MNNKLRALLVVIGFAGTAAVFSALPDVDKADLLDAGIGGCVDAEAIVAVRTVDGYDNWRVKAWDCGADGGLVLDPDAFADAGVLDIVPTGRGAAFKAESRVPMTAQERWRKEPSECACAPADADGGAVASNCEVAGDGGWVAAPTRVHFGPNQWRGTQCVRKACGEMAGQSSWPSACGPE